MCGGGCVGVGRLNGAFVLSAARGGDWRPDYCAARPLSSPSIVGERRLVECREEVGGRAVFRHAPAPAAALSCNEKGVMVA